LWVCLHACCLYVCTSVSERVACDRLFSRFSAFATVCATDDAAATAREAAPVGGVCAATSRRPAKDRVRCQDSR
jgi:hypothetical protein